MFKINHVASSVLLLLIISQLNACGINANAELPINSVEFSEILAGDTPTGVAVMTRKAQVFNDQESFATELYQYAQFFTPVKIDFSTKQVALVTLQQFTNGGYKIEIIEAKEFDKYVALTVEITYPGNGCNTTTSLSAPYQFVSLNSTKPVIFEESFMVTVC